MIWSAEAPANIALIKYMGKSKDNIPLNSSFSFTLDLFKTRVTLKAINENEDRWVPEANFTTEEQARFLKHLSFLREAIGGRHFFEIDSVNSFPARCGLASSASSFAALTLCAAKAFGELKSGELADQTTINQQHSQTHDLNFSQTLNQRLSQLSRRGSGSSCRSFFSPFALWSGDGCQEVSDLPSLLHQVVIVESSPKIVSSSQAHERALTSDLWNGRTERAEIRLQVFLNSMKHNSWKSCFEIAWAEFWDMHSLFETSHPPFGYMNEKSMAVLNLVRKQWQGFEDGPIVTMDAGPNVHLLYRLDQRDLMVRFRREELGNFKVLGHHT